MDNKTQHNTTIVLTGGGTGGHVIPNLSLVPLLRKHFDKIIYIGSSGIEKELTKGIVDVFYEVPACKFRRDNLLANLFLPFKLAKSVHMCKKLLKKIKPDIIFSKGGYVAVPVCLAGKACHIKIVGHESDLTLGKANKLIYKLSNKFCTTFEKTSEKLPKGIFTGSPIRNELFCGKRENGKKITGFDGTRKTILFTGGSTGAKGLNDVVFKSLNELTQKYDVIHLVGKGKGNNQRMPHYYQAEFCKDIQDLFAISNVVVSRAGSNVIYELLALNKPMILVPLPKGTSRGDQIENAGYFAKKGYATTILQEDLNEKKLVQEIDKIIAQENKLVSHLKSLPKEKLINGAKNIVEVILKTKNTRG